MNKVSANAGTHPATESLLIPAVPPALVPPDLVTLRPGYDPAAFQTTKKLPRQVIVTDASLATPRLEIIDNNGNSETITVLPAWVPFSLSVQPAQLGLATNVDVLVLW